MKLAPTFRLSWRRPGGQAISAGAAALALDPEADLAPEVVCGRGSWQLWVTARRPVELVSAGAAVHLDLAGADALYLNGYNSWTDSWERPPAGAMPGLSRTPRLAVRRWVLDASGDYRFARQDARPGRQHGIGYGYLRRGGDVALLGESRPDAGVTVIYEDLESGCLRFEKEGPGRALKAGERVCAFSLVAFEGALEDAFARYAAALGATRRPAPPLVGYSSWYRHYGDIDAGKLGHDLDGVSASLARLDLGCARPLFQIDDGYTKVGDWMHPDGRRFPQGMGSLADKISACGLVPGLWMAPFVCERDSAVFSAHSDWLLRDDAGQPVRSGPHWSGAFALDSRHPEVREHVRASLSTMTGTWGYRFLKLDFLYAAALLPHDGLNRGELMADALDLLRASVPKGTLLDFCGVPVMSAFGRCEYCRIGCDVGLDWDGRRLMRLAGRERVSTRNSLGSTRGRAHLNGVVFLNDPDVFFLRDDVKLDAAQRSRLLAADAQLGGMLLTSDDMGAWDEAQHQQFERALATFTARFGGEGADE